MKTRSSNILKTTNVTNFTKAILKRFYKVLWVTSIWKTLKQPVYFLKAVEFCSTFWHSNWHNSGYISEKVAKTTFFRKSKEVKTGRQTCYFLIFAFSLFPNFKWLLSKIWIWSVLRKFYYVTNIFDLHNFDSETAALLNFFEIYKEMHFAFYFFLYEWNITASLLKVYC